MADLILNWGLFGTYGTQMGASNTVDTGGVEVTVGFAEEDEGAQAFTFNAEGYVDDEDPFNAFSFLKLFGEGGEGGVDNTSTTTLDFAATNELYSDEVQNVSFRLNEIDADGAGDPHLDIVTITAWDAEGNEVPVSITAGSDVSTSGDTVSGNNPYELMDGAASALVEIEGPVARVQIDYDNGDVADQRVTVTDVHFSTIDADDENGDPVANPDMLETDEDTAIVFDPRDNDTDPDGDPLTITSATADNGTVTIDPITGELTYTPDPDYNGPDTITYVVDDGNGGTASSTVAVEVLPINDAPVAEDDVAETEEGTPVTIPVLLNDSDVDGDPLDVTAADAANGRAAVNPDGDILYTPNPGFVGEDTISYTVDDGNGGTDTAQVIVTVTEDGVEPDGIVEGTEGDDVIDFDYVGDPHGDLIDHGDELLAGEGPEDDIVLGHGGDDLVNAGLGNDDIDGGLGDDTLNGQEGDDLVVGEEGDDVLTGGTGEDTLLGGDGADTARGGDDDDVIHLGTLGTPLPDTAPFPGIPVDADPEDDRDRAEGGDGNDTITTGDDADTIIGGAGDDVIDAGIDDDIVRAGDGDDLITDPHGADYVHAGLGDDTILVGIDTFSDYVGDDPNLPAPGFPGILADPNTVDGMDTVFAGGGNDYVETGDDADFIDGGSGHDTVLAGIDDDTVSGGLGDDSIIGGHGSDSLLGGAGDDYIDASSSTLLFGDEPDATDPVPTNDLDFVDGGAGNDVIFGGDDDDTLMGGRGNDAIDGGIDEDLIYGEGGNDTITGGEGADTLFGGNGRDDFLGATAGDVIDGGDGPVDDGPQDFDTLDLTGSAPAGGGLRVIYDPLDAQNGTVEFLDGVGDVTGTMVFTEIENVIPCFTPGTAIATPKGERFIEDLQVGDRVITRDNGIQEIRWTGAKELTGHQLARAPHLRPVLIQKGSLGNGLPEHDILVSPQHRVLVANDKTSLYFEETEVLAAAKHLTGMAGIDEVGTLGVTYMHMMFERHEVVLSNGAWTESFQPGANVLDGLGNEQRSEIFELFPELKTHEGIDAYNAARRSLKKHEAQLLVK